MMTSGSEKVYGPRRIDADSRAPGAARRWLSQLDDPRARDTQIGLVASELVTNVVTHTSAPEAELSITLGPGSVRVEVHDSSRHMPALVDRDRSAPSRGLGLRIVEAIAARWGVEEHDDGKTVWAEFDVRDGIRRGGGPSAR